MSYNKIGDVLVAQGDLPEALKAFRDSLAIRRPSGQGRPRQRRLAARSVGVLREDRRRAGGAGQSAGGAESLPRQPRHRDRLAKADPGNAGWQRDLSVSYDKIGDVLVAQGNLPEALKSFRDSLAITDRLAKADPGNAGWQRDLSVSYEQDRRRAGGAGRSAGGAEILPRRPRHRRPAGQGRPRQRRLAARSVGVYEKIGDVLVAQGNLPEALKAFRDSLAISERLAKADPGNAGWQRDLSVSHERSATCWWRRAICPRR